MAKESEIRVGMRVNFKMVAHAISGIVKEDRGPIGFRGRRLYGIKFNIEPSEDSYIELPAEEIAIEQHAPA